MNPTHFTPTMRLLTLLPWIAVFAPGAVPALTLELQRRDPATGAITLQTEEVDPKRIGVIAVDVWNY